MSMASGINDPWDIPLDDVDPDKIGGFQNPLPGRYHGQVIFIDPDDPKTGKLIVDVEVLAGIPANQEGLRQRIFMSHPRNVESEGGRRAAAGKQIAFAIAVGLTTKEEVKRVKEERRRFTIDWQLAVGRQLLFEVQTWESGGKSGTSVEFGMWHLTDPRGAGIPINQGMLEKAGDGGGSDGDPFGSALDEDSGPF